MTDLGLLYADTAGNADSVNAKDQAVGVTLPCTKVNRDDSCEGPIYHAFLWENGSMVELQTLVVPGSGITLSCALCGEAAYNINDRGEIAGQALLSDGNSRAILLNPVRRESSKRRGLRLQPCQRSGDSQQYSLHCSGSNASELDIA